MKLSDMLFANAMMGEGGGGGDLSTAQMTIVNNLNDIPIYIYGSCIVNDTLKYVSEFEVGTSSVSTVLYKGSSIIWPDAEEFTVTVSGSATIDDGRVTITGDCTITIS